MLLHLLDLLPDLAGSYTTNRLLRSSMVEHSAVNRRVVGSSPTGGARFVGGENVGEVSRL